MAVVYSATHRMQKQFAVKMLHPELSLREDLRQRFLREGVAANSVKHPGAVAVTDNDTTEDGAAFLVMELLEGDEVQRLCEMYGGRMPVERVLAIAHQLLDVLAAAHVKAIVHRDIKPANLFVTYEGQLKVLDFGIARVRDARGVHSDLRATHHARSARRDVERDRRDPSDDARGGARGAGSRAGCAAGSGSHARRVVARRQSRSHARRVGAWRPSCVHARRTAAY
jgi:serine/threonine protein kinase